MRCTIRPTSTIHLALVRPARAGRRAVQVMATAKVPNTDLLKVAQRAAEAGATIVRDAVDKPRNITFKGATDLVTDTDKASEEAILAVIRREFPDHAILGEEGGESRLATNAATLSLFSLWHWMIMTFPTVMDPNHC
jgi:myo-inositol-1(or 4)-monophosphatase